MFREIWKIVETEVKKVRVIKVEREREKEEVRNIRCGSH